MKQTSHTLTAAGKRLSYLLYLPPNYDAEAKHPLILFLHGSGERGNDPKRVAATGLPEKLEREDLPFVVVSPQCPAETWWTWHLEALIALFDHAITAYKIDPSRVYLSGLSMGGYGTWYLAARHPQRFAAILPICGGGEVERACALKNMPIWTFHGAKDDVVPLSQSQMMVDAITKCGGQVDFTIYPNVKHDSWTQTYANREIYDWLLRHQLD